MLFIMLKECKMVMHVGKNPNYTLSNELKTNKDKLY